jgi:hypothetical protein
MMREKEVVLMGEYEVEVKRQQELLAEQDRRLVAAGMTPSYQ